MVLTGRPPRALALFAVVAAALAGQAAARRPTLAPRAAGVHVLAKGESLSQVARRTGVTLAELARANAIADVHRVRAGVRLRIPGREPPVVVGERLPARLRARPDRLALLPVFDAAAREHGVPADVLKAMTWMESGWQNDKVSSVGARGIGQLMPATVDFLNGRLLARRLDPRRPDHNIRMSARFLRYLLDRYRGDVHRALAAYYQGAASVDRIGPYKDTERYVRVVLALRPRFA